MSRKIARSQETVTVIGAAIRTISRHGLADASLERIAKAAGLPPGKLHDCFVNRETLLLETLGALCDDLGACTAMSPGGTDEPGDILESFVNACFSAPWCTAERVAAWYAFCRESAAYPRLEALCNRQHVLIEDFLTDNILGLLAQQGISVPVPYASVKGLRGIMDTHWHDLILDPARFRPEAAISECLRYLDRIADPSAARSGSPPTADCTDHLPVWTYRNSEFLELEKDELFRKNWLLVGHVSDIPNPRDFLTLNAVNERSLVIRGDDGVIRAFHNVCRHRGARLKREPSGKRAHAISCPFHGWTYRLDGSLLKVPSESTFPDLDMQHNRLIPLEVDIWMGFVFIRFKGSGKGMADLMEPVSHLMEPYRIEQMKPLKHTAFSQVRPYNWKVMHEIDNEGYHIPIGHPTLHQLFDDSYEDTVIGGIAVSRGIISDKPSRAWSTRHYQELLPQADHLPAGHRKLWLYTAVFPNLVFGLYPDSMEFYMTLPLTPHKTLYRGAAYALPDDRPGMVAARYLNRRINMKTEAEDEQYMVDMQEGMDSSAFPAPQLSALESGVRNFHRRIQERLPVSRRTHPPASGLMAEMNRQMSG